MYKQSVYQKQFSELARKCYPVPWMRFELPASGDFQATHGYVWVRQTSRRRGLRGPKMFVEITLSHIQQEWFDVWVFLEFEGPVERIGFPFLRGHLAGKTVASTRGCSRVLGQIPGLYGLYVSGTPQKSQFLLEDVGRSYSPMASHGHKALEFTSFFEA